MPKKTIIDMRPSHFLMLVDLGLDEIFLDVDVVFWLDFFKGFRLLCFLVLDGAVGLDFLLRA